MPTDNQRPLRALLIDPSLFTGPYDAALTEGLVSAGVEPAWLVRRTRDEEEVALDRVATYFYRRVDGLTWLPAPLRALAKGVAHAVGLASLVRRVWARRPDVVHFQWPVVPLLDALAIRLIARRCPVVFTVHDSVPYNGDRLSWLQRLGFDVPIRLSDRIIVHTESGRARLLERGVASDKVSVIPHGPLRLRAAPPPAPAPLGRAPRADARQTFVLFGQIKPYKGADLLVEAIGRVPPALRRRARFIIAGRPRIDLAPLRARMTELGIDDATELWPRWLSEAEMGDLFAQADCFLFPYRQIDASGVYSLTRSYRKWVIASRVGVFAEDIDDGAEGTLVPPEDPVALADAIADAIRRRPTPNRARSTPVWHDIGRATRDVYEQARARAA